jgi:hypothetical protein
MHNAGCLQVLHPGVFGDWVGNDDNTLDIWRAESVVVWVSVARPVESIPDTR